MIVNKKFDRFKQWAGEKMGNEARTTNTDDFKALEVEMNLRHDGMERLHKSMSLYVKAMAKKSEGDDKQLPVGHLGSVMAGHGQDFSPDSEFGHCLLSFGKANESIARRQESFVTNSTSLWLESLERSLAQMKEYQIARKRLETRRLAYDTSLAKVQKAKKEDFRVEEELRAQKAKYEESSEDVSRRMEDIKDAEIESIVDLTRFLDEELDYHERCRNILLDLRTEWSSASGASRSSTRGRSTALPTHHERTVLADPLPEQLPPRPVIAKVTKPEAFVATTYRRDSPPPQVHRHDAAVYTSPTVRHDWHTPPNSAGLAETGSAVYQRQSRDTSPDKRDYAVSAVHEHAPVMASNTFVHTPLRSLARAETAPMEVRQSPLLARTRNVSLQGQQTPYGMAMSRESTSPSSELSSTVGLIGGAVGGAVKKAPPPPPPSRAKKPAPPPPMKRAAFSSPGGAIQQDHMVAQRVLIT